MSPLWSEAVLYGISRLEPRCLCMWSKKANPYTEYTNCCSLRDGRGQCNQPATRRGMVPYREFMQGGPSMVVLAQSVLIREVHVIMSTYNL